MKSDNYFTTRFSLLAGVVGQFLYFPVWWYSTGLLRFSKRIFYFWQDQFYSLGVWVWIKNIFVPMYGQFDITGRLISFLVRLVQIVARTFILLAWLIACLILVILWIAWPLALAWAIYEQLLA